MTETNRAYLVHCQGESFLVYAKSELHVKIFLVEHLDIHLIHDKPSIYRPTADEVYEMQQMNLKEYRLG